MTSWFGPSADIDADLSDPPLLQDNSTFKSYKTSQFEYTNLRVFYRQHVKADQLPAALPLLVCVPGLGGSVAQFHPLLNSLSDLAPCLAMDFPGGGRSKFSINSWDAYTTQALVELLETVIEDHRAPDQSVVLIGHSMGTALCAWLASKSSPHKTKVADHVTGFVAICPVSSPIDEAKTTLIRRLMWVPGWVFALWRMWDGMGGPNSPSVARFVGDAGDEELKVLQYRYNQQSRTPVWRRMVHGALPTYTDGKPSGGFPTCDIWAGLEIPVYLIAGESDHLTPPKEVETIVTAMKAAHKGEEAAAPTSVEISLEAQHHISIDMQSNAVSSPDADGSPSEPLSPADAASTGVPPQPAHPQRAVQSTVMPAPANHTLLYSHRSVRALAGLISDFLATHVTGRLSLAWQLQYLSREGKWDVKNLNKWKAVPPVSEPIGPSNGPPIFMVMKTLREADDVHCPRVFAQVHGELVKDVLDISKDQPVYDPRGLEREGIHYHKFATISKVPPSHEEVETFIGLVDKIRAAQAERAAAEGWETGKTFLVGVHCHYGFNRSGYFVVCYLVERCGMSLEDAIATFGRMRPNGIRHSHFLDRLHVRYDLHSV
ncbi:Putative Dual specificity phosphatase catalytic domain protein [[Torrubiella] hemipterigena]|uniref:Putative Dual specificity phosphatase catalytic domain protein n=1 Tax=[Torrubiella] hemipterigena TaxID=1531966 RepID=A0A0A1T6P8_9HYPO|nr:Putative Dual specificity phosphatase catalytic domain protein [[Torrubiella] hemipterigena]